jgi:hypothetical protein
MFKCTKVTKKKAVNRVNEKSKERQRKIGKKRKETTEGRQRLEQK